ncbi:retrovirus-related pol polyprotein from transposon TNT 1-94 [Tanacetum coccineum]
MAAVNDVPHLVDKKGGSYASIAPKLEPRKFNKWKKRMLCYLAGMEPYYLKCIKDGLFQPKIAEGDAKPESQWTPDKRRVVVQDQRLKSIIMSCLPDNIMESVISCVLTKETWIDLVHSFEGPLNTKENRIIDLKLKYQTFRAKSTESLSQTYTRYKTMLNELDNDDVNLSKHEINVGFVNSLPEKWLTFSQGLRNANHTHTLDLADIYGSQKANENTKCYKCGNKGHFARDCFSKTSEPSYKLPVNNYSLVSKGFQPKFTPKRIQSSSNSNNQADPKFQKDYKAEYKKIKAKLALLEAIPSSSQNPKTFLPKNKGLVAKTFNWDAEEFSDEEEVTQVKVLMALADDELTVRKSHARNGEWVDITMRKLNHALQEQLKVENKINEKWLTSSKKVSQCISEQIPPKKKKVIGGELFTESSSKMNENENLFVPTSMGHDQEMVPKTKDWVERLNADSKLPNFNIGRILVLESQAVNESLKPTKTPNTPESSKDSEAESLTPLPPLKNLQGASPSSDVMPLTFQSHSPRERPGLGIMKHTKAETHDSLDKSISGTVIVSETKPTTPSVPIEVKNIEQELKINELTKLVQMLIGEKVNSTQMTQESNLQIQQSESSKSVDSSKISQDSKPKVQNVGSSKSLRRKPIQKP